MRPKFQGIGYAIIALWMAGPLVLAFSAGGIALAAGCTLNESGAHPCRVFGSDIGETLYAMGVMGFLAIATIPTGMVLLVLFFAFNWWWRSRLNARV
jgi:hypothetical protein